VLGCAAAGEQQVGEQDQRGECREAELGGGRQHGRRDEAFDEAGQQQQRTRADQQGHGLAGALDQHAAPRAAAGQHEGGPEPQARAAGNADGSEFDDAVGQDERPEVQVEPLDEEQARHTAQQHPVQQQDQRRAEPREDATGKREERHLHIVRDDPAGEERHHDLRHIDVAAAFLLPRGALLRPRDHDGRHEGAGAVRAVRHGGKAGERRPEEQQCGGDDDAGAASHQRGEPAGQPVPGDPRGSGRGRIQQVVPGADGALERVQQFGRRTVRTGAGEVGRHLTVERREAGDVRLGQRCEAGRTGPGEERVVLGPAAALPAQQGRSGGAAGGGRGACRRAPGRFIGEDGGEQRVGMLRVRRVEEVAAVGRAVDVLREVGGQGGGDPLPCRALQRGAAQRVLAQHVVLAVGQARRAGRGCFFRQRCRASFAYDNGTRGDIAQPLRAGVEHDERATQQPRRQRLDVHDAQQVAHGRAAQRQRIAAVLHDAQAEPSRTLPCRRVRARRGPASAWQ
jgi:hypothetical protein